MKMVIAALNLSRYFLCMEKQYNYDKGEAIIPIELSIILFSNSHNFVYHAHRFHSILKILLNLMLMALQIANIIILLIKWFLILNVPFLVIFLYFYQRTKSNNY